MIQVSVHVQISHMAITRPMLAATARVPEDIWYPCLATPKIDGIRALKIGGLMVSRSFKPIRNSHVQKLCGELPDGIDGELLCGNFQETTSAVMSYGGIPDFAFLAFDLYGPQSYYERIGRLMQLSLPSFVTVLEPRMLHCLADLLDYEAECLELGYEGVVTRNALGPYLCGRSTLRAQHMVKFKRVLDSDAMVLHVQEGFTNTNPIVPNAFGYAKRPGGGEGKIPRGTMGSLLCRDLSSGILVNVGGGFTEAMRAEIWAQPLAYVGRVLKYAYQGIGVKDAPRFPRFLSWRDDADVSPAF